jgi:hypothetical protein
MVDGSMPIHHLATGSLTAENGVRPQATPESHGVIQSMELGEGLG